MPYETPFRIAVLVIMLGTALGALYHRLRARTDEQITHEAEGRLFATVLRLLGLGLWVVTLIYLINPRLLAWAALPIPAWLRWGAVVVASAAGAAMVYTLSYLGKNLTDTVVTRRNAELVTIGPYAWVRHPMYSTAFTLMAAVSIVAANGLPATIVCGVIAMLVIRTPHEEAGLVARFGDAYRTYMRSTGRFLPKFGKRRNGSRG